MNKVIRSITGAVLMVMLTTNTALATPPNYNTDAIGRQSSATQAEIERTISKMNKLNNDMSKLISELNQNKMTMDFLIQDIEKNNKKIEESKIDLEKKQDIFNMRARVMYMNDFGSSMFMLLLDSKDLYDMLDRIESIKIILNYDKEIIADVEAGKIVLENDLKKQETSKAQLAILNTSNQKKQGEMVTQKELLLGRLASLNIVRGQEIQSSKVKYIQETLKKDFLAHKFPDLRLKREIIDYKNNLDFYSGVDLETSIAVTGQDLVLYASSFLGVTYLWGGVSTSGFDCSGFTKYVMKHFGIVIPRVSEMQQNVGLEIKRGEDLQPGDLIYYGTPAHHVGMVISKDYMIEAPYTGDVVKVSPLRKNWTTVRRYINLPKELVEAQKKNYKRNGPQPEILDLDVKELPIPVPVPATTP